MQRPLPNEYKPYFQQYIDLVGDGDFSELFQQKMEDAIVFFKSIPVAKHNYRYAEGKWTVKEILMHVIDMDRVFTYRALVAGRGDSVTPLLPADENLFARNAFVTIRNMDSLLDEFSFGRKSAALLFENLADAQSKLPGNTQGHITTPRACAYMMMGHMMHHINIIKERYL